MNRNTAAADISCGPKAASACPVLSVTGVGDNLVDLALGARWNFWGNSLINGNIVLPLNRDEGLRADVIWTIGIEHTF